MLLAFPYDVSQKATLDLQDDSVETVWTFSFFFFFFARWRKDLQNDSGIACGVLALPIILVFLKC